ncbi:hypothetical protein [Methanocella arvoryzae]|uniref:Uncharacterized protein n=1 Tax=Methanocella arvoryzae (strain DSM 22066 / NBRC 105507 / MRE50) TaxID=351160 RepID=Q0W4V2_METAR|nr:hypothetical protein [Methanocella arvoryzae]CAJ36591.1 hypothetical protein RCIX1302 [Methanocella arvoryzae MRE50]
MCPGMADDNAEALPTIIECSQLNYSMADEKGEPLAGGEASASINAESLSVSPRMGEPLLLSLREITALNAADYRLEIVLSSGEKLAFFNLGRRFDDFVRELVKARNEILLKDMLMEEKVLKQSVKGTYSLSEGEQVSRSGPCEVRVYETGLLVLPEASDPFRLPFSFISSAQAQDYRLTVTTERGQTLVLSMLGREFDPLTRALNDAMNALSLKAQATFKELVPLADSSMVRKAARHAKDGRAAMKKDLDAVSPRIWPEMEKKLEAAGVFEEYRYLKSIGQADRMCIGVKKGLPADPNVEYVWYLTPVYGEGGKPGNALIMEAVSIAPGETPEEEEPAEPEAEEEVTEDGQKSIGKATYVFRIVSRKDYPGMSKADLDRAAEEAVRTLNDCMIAINFRREPIFLSDEKLREPANLQYLYSVQRLPELRYLRERFVGRVAHAGKEKWKKDLSALLAFNVGTADDSVRWSKA